jgi:hypothetical protein
MQQIDAAEEGHNHPSTNNVTVSSDCLLHATARQLLHAGMALTTFFFMWLVQLWFPDTTYMLLHRISYIYTCMNSLKVQLLQAKGQKEAD